MGEVNTEQHSGRISGLIPRRKRLSTRVDMTPVVDLAFLLLTFFMLATTFIKPQVMELILPEKPNAKTASEAPKVNERRVLSIVLGGDNKIYWYVGVTAPKVQETDYSGTGIREVLLTQNRRIHKLVVLLKPGPTSTYKNLVDILDELEITNIARYALVGMDADDKALMAKYLGGGGSARASGVQEIGTHS